MKLIKLNPQGLARGHKGLMSSIVADPDHVFISCDLTSGEPTATTHYSKDKNYYDANFGMVGKEPYYDKNLLRIDDIYLMVMSVSPMGKDRMREVFEASYDGKTFAQVWLDNKEFIQKKILKDERKLHKALALGLSYSMGPRKLVKQASDSGFNIPFPVAKKFYQQYWDLFSGVWSFGKQLESALESNGYLINDFGYRLVPKEKYKALNYYIQSTISGIVNALCVKFFSVFPDAQFVSIIHDEVIFQIHKSAITEAKMAWEGAVASLNVDLGWSVAIRTGWAQGTDLYTAK